MNSAKQENVTFITQDQCMIEGTVYIPETPNGFGILCLHQLGLDRHSYSHLAAELQTKGFHVLAIDLRGHGKSTQFNGQTISYETMPEGDFSKIPGQDVEGAKELLATSYSINPERIGMIGASIGANAALISEGRDPRVAFVVALSPGLDFRSMQPEQDVSQIQKPVLYVASQEDTYSATSAQLLFEKTSSATKQFQVVQNVGHGTHMLENDPSLEAFIVNWIMERT